MSGIEKNSNHKSPLERIKQGARIAAAALTIGMANADTPQAAEQVTFDRSFTRAEMMHPSPLTDMSKNAFEFLNKNRSRINFDSATGALRITNADGSILKRSPEAQAELAKIQVSSDGESTIAFSYILKGGNLQVVNARKRPDGNFTVDGDPL